MLPQFGKVQGAFGLLVADAGLPMREWARAFRSPYWDHHSGLLDWSSAAGNFSVPSNKHLFVPVQWPLAASLTVACSPALTHIAKHIRVYRKLSLDGVDACRRFMRAGTVLDEDADSRNTPTCTCRVTAATAQLIESRAPFSVQL